MSQVETFGLVAGEAIGLGLPIIVGDNTGVGAFLTEKSRGVKGDAFSDEEWKDMGSLIHYVVVSNHVDKNVNILSSSVEKWMDAIDYWRGCDDEKTGYNIRLIRKLWGDTWEQSIRNLFGSKLRYDASHSRVNT